MRLLIIVLFLSSQFVQAHENHTEGESIPFCSFRHARSIVELISPLAKHDKFKHCAVSCQLRLRCESNDVFELGLMKELRDALWVGDADFNDIRANMIGISYASNGDANTDSECFDICDRIDWDRFFY